MNYLKVYHKEQEILILKMKYIIAAALFAAAANATEIEGLE